MANLSDTQNLKRQKRAWVLVDVGNSAFACTVLAAVFPVYLPSLLPSEGIQFTWGSMAWKSTALSLWAYTVSFSVFITFLLSPLLGTWADRGGFRKRLFMAFTILGILGTTFLAFTKTWYLALLSFVIANIGFSASNVFYNSMLADLAPTEDEKHELSLRGFAWGYIGGGILLAINLAMIMKFEVFGLSSKAQALELTFLSVSLWWLLFSLPAFFFIEESKQNSESSTPALLQIYYTLKESFKQPSLILFLASYMLFNEGIQTVISMSALFGKEALSLQESTLIGTLLVVQILGLPFTLGMNAVSRKLGAKKTLSYALLFWIFIISYAHWMQTARDFWILGILVAVVLGVSQALPRSIFAGMTPPNKQAEYFSLLALTGKMTSVMGPFVFGLTKDLTNDARISILSLGAFFVAGLFLFLFVSIEPKEKPS